MQDVKITYIGHSTTLIEAPGMAILTDPIFSQNVLHIKRRSPLKFNPANLPELTAVLISHAHFDHLDLPSFNYIKTSVPIVIPEGSEKIVSKHLPNPIIELSNWATHNFSENLKIHATPTVHTNFRLCPCFFRKAAGYVIEINSKNICFIGDSAYGTHFHDIGNTHSIDVALLPISCYKPNFIMKRSHMDPIEAIQAFMDLKAKTMIPIHWGTFKLSLERFDEPIEWLKKIVIERGLEDRVKILEASEAYHC